MENPAIGYLYTLAVLSMTFVGFTALVAILRQTAGGRSTRLDIFLTRTFIQLGLMATGGSMLVPLLALSELQMAKVWSVSSAIAAIVLGGWVVTYPKRRMATSEAKTPVQIWALVGILGISVVTLIFSAVIPTEGQHPILYAAPVTAILFVGAMWLVASLYFLISNAPAYGAKGKRKKLVPRGK